MNYDLHSHSHYSDGEHSPQFLLDRALGNGVTHLAITDHDCVDAYKEAVELSDPGRITLVPGVEISCAWGTLEIHVLGLMINPEQEGLRRFLTAQQDRRRARIARIEEKLIKRNIHGFDEFIAALPARALTRSHVAQFLVEAKVCKDRKKAFKAYLSRRGALYSPGQWPALTEAISTICDAGGIAVLAHPNRYGLSTRKLRGLLGDFVSFGGKGMEVCYSNLDAGQQGLLRQLCKEFDLWASCGSDFHTASATWMDLGKIPQLHGELTNRAIWKHPIWLQWIENYNRPTTVNDGAVQRRSL